MSGIDEDKDDSDNEGFDEASLSRTQRKVEERAEQAKLEELAKVLASMQEKKLEALSLDPMLLEAVRTFARMPKGSGLARQRRFVARLLRSYDLVELTRRVQIARGVVSDDARMYRLEQWRTRLVEEGDAALQTFMDEHPNADRQRLRQLIRSTLAERAEGKTNKQWKALFQLLKEASETKS